ncbi:MAG: molybdopterin molybdotransferase MoeA [Pirellulaceae bacterium]|nr:molybdopterin molybdotransferase MoeA [Pirellulaceae bacterium]
MNNSKQPRNFSDVRMRGFTSRSTVTTVWQWIDQHSGWLDSESVFLGNASGRVLADSITSQVDVPGFRRAMMDGFAVQSADTLGATPYNPLKLTITGEAFPGQPFLGHVQRGQTVRIMTGSPMPNGADAVLPAERTQTEASHLLAQGEVPPQKHVGHRGEDIPTGTCILERGRRLRPQDLGVLSSIGVGQVSVIRQPKIRLVITGNELVASGTVPTGYTIADANGPMLSALVRRDGGVVVEHGLTPDTESSILTAMQDDVDIVIVSGGSSVGLEDHAPRLLAQNGELAIHGVAMRPSSPTGMGRMDDRLVFLLPGNPVSCLCAYDFFAGRAIRTLAGGSLDWPYRQSTLPLRRKLVSQVGRVDYARVSIVDQAIDPLAISGASLLSSTTRADGFVIIPTDSEGYPPEHQTEVFLYDA